jgi:hypothetical protein
LPNKNKKRKLKSGQGSQREARYPDLLVDRLSAARRTPTPRYKLYAHKNACKPKFVNVFDNKAAAQIGTNVRALGFNAGLLARSQFASRGSSDRPTRSGFSVVFLGLRANAELVPKFHVALHASHAALPMVTLKFRPNVALQLSD